MPQFPQSLRLDLPDAFSCDMELFSDFLKCPASSIFQPKPQSQYFLFPLCQCLLDIIQLLLQKRVRCSIGRHFAFVVFDKIAKMCVILFPDRRFQ